RGIGWRLSFRSPRRVDAIGCRRIFRVERVAEPTTSAGERRARRMTNSAYEFSDSFFFVRRLHLAIRVTCSSEALFRIAVLRMRSMIDVIRISAVACAALRNRRDVF